MFIFLSNLQYSLMQLVFLSDPFYRWENRGLGRGKDARPGQESRSPESLACAWSPQGSPSCTQVGPQAQGGEKEGGGRLRLGRVPQGSPIYLDPQLQALIYFFFLSRHKACGILAP